MHLAPLLYLDPGSGSFLIQLAVAAVLGLSVAIGASWSKIKRLFGVKPNPTAESTDDDDDEDEPETK